MVCLTSTKCNFKIHLVLWLNYLKSFFLANGMNRGEACVSVFLQKSTEAKRSYGTLLNVIGIFGETNDLFYHYSDNLYKETLLEAYKKAGVDPAKVAYVEGEGLGVKVYLENLNYCLFTLKSIVLLYN